MNDRQKNISPRNYSTRAPTYLSARTLLYGLYILGIIFLSLVATRINPLYLIALILAGTVAANSAN